VAIQLAGRIDLPTGRILIDALGSMFEYNLIPFQPTLQNRVGSISTNSVGSETTCVRGEETQIANQQ
jgi:hypothetical protein